jgi:hypothetical protein
MSRLKYVLSLALVKSIQGRIATGKRDHTGLRNDLEDFADGASGYIVKTVGKTNSGLVHGKASFKTKNPQFSGRRRTAVPLPFDIADNHAMSSSERCNRRTGSILLAAAFRR